MIKESYSTFDTPIGDSYEKLLFLLIFFLSARNICNHTHTIQYKAKEECLDQSHDYASSNPDAEQYSSLRSLHSSTRNEIDNPSINAGYHSLLCCTPRFIPRRFLKIGFVPEHHLLAGDFDGLAPRGRILRKPGIRVRHWNAKWRRRCFRGCEADIRKSAEGLPLRLWVRLLWNDAEKPSNKGLERC